MLGVITSPLPRPATSSGTAIAQATTRPGPSPTTTVVTVTLTVTITRPAATSGRPRRVTTCPPAAAADPSANGVNVSPVASADKPSPCCRNRLSTKNTALKPAK